MVDKKFIVLMVIAVFFVIAATLLTYGTSYYIHKTFTPLPVVQDLLWKILPYDNVIWLSESLLVLSAIIAIIWAVKQNKKNLIPYTMIILSIFHMCRALLIVLTPLGFPYKYAGFLHPEDSIFAIGAFPSGHLSVPYLIFMITKKKIHILLTFLVALTLLISRGHYSIDLIGTLLLAYPVFKFSERYFGKYFENDK